jgi:hypothetical protein
MATLFVLKFNDPYGADRVLLALQGRVCRSRRSSCVRLSPKSRSNIALGDEIALERSAS